MTKLTIDINGWCNHRCKFCYQSLDGSELPESEILGLVDKFQDAQVVELGGGEPFLDKRIIPLIRKLTDKGKSVHISTNATIIPAGLLGLEERIRQNTQVQTSLHASNRELHYSITGNDTFNTTVENIQRLKDYFQVSVSSAVFNENYDDVDNLVQLVDGFGLPLRVNVVFPVGLGKNVQILTPQQIDNLRGYLLQQRILKGNKVDSPLLHTNNCYALSESYGVKKERECPVDCGKVYISPKGEGFSCEFYRRPLVQIQPLRSQDGI